MNHPNELAVISGKGGTGKTSLTAALACLSERAVLADADVDAADLHLILEPTVIKEEEFIGGQKAEIQLQLCLSCGKCLELCRFKAVIVDGNDPGSKERSYFIDRTACEGCAVCARFCPHEAIDMVDNISGRWFVSRTRHGTMVHACLGVAQENSGKMVTLIREEAGRIARKEGFPLIIIDGPPGIGCPVIASITGCDFVLIVAEPTLSGFHDMRRAAELTARLRIPTAICINKQDINPSITGNIEDWSDKAGLKVLGRISYDPVMTRAQMIGLSVMEYGPSRVAKEIGHLWKAVKKEMHDGSEEKPVTAFPGLSAWKGPEKKSNVDPRRVK
jgi:MinD superfamily P-loop ATPase